MSRRTLPRSELHGRPRRVRARATHILCLSQRGRLEQPLDLRVEISRNLKRCLMPVGSQEARHGVVRQVHSISALVDENRDGRVRGGIGNSLRYFLHDERLPTTKRSIFGPWPPRSLRKTSPESKRDEFDQIRGSDRLSHHSSSSTTVEAEASPSWNAFMSGRPMVAVSLCTISSNGRCEITLNLRTGMSTIVGKAPLQVLALRNRRQPIVRPLLDA